MLKINVYSMILKYNIMRKIQLLLNKYWSQKLDSNDIKSFKVMMKHINSKDTTILSTPDGVQFIISNERTHYDLIINDVKIQLVNTTDVRDIHVSDRIKEKVIYRVRDTMSKHRMAKINEILARKENTLDNILSKMK
jgi:hypothetical protein